MNNDYIWYLTDIPKIPKNGYKVFTTFSCGGGSSMGYKLAGYEVIGNCEIDPAINAMYVKNHHPKYNFLMGVQDFYKQDNIPEELFDIDVLDGSPPCFPAGTLVLTEKGYKSIEEIRVGDMVYTHKNRFRRVTRTMSHDANNLMRVKIQGCETMTVTENHPYYVRVMKRKGSFGQRAFSEPKFVEAKDLFVRRNCSNAIMSQCYCGIPVIQEEVIPEYRGLEETCKTPHGGRWTKEYKDLCMDDPRFWRFVGRWLGDGWFRHDGKNVIICCGKKDKEEVEKIISDVRLKASCSELRTSFRFTISNVELYAFMKQFGSGADEKHIPISVLQLPNDLLRALLEGYLSADGHYEKRDKKWVCSSASEKLIYGLQMAVAKVYHQPTTIVPRVKNTERIEGRKVNTKKSWGLAFKKEACKQQHFIYEDGYIWVPFRSAERIEDTAVVYNFSVDEDETYTVFNISVHNCSAFSMAGDREKVWGKEKHFREGQAKQVLDDLFFEYLNVVEKLRPKVCVAENVKGLISGNAKGYVNLIFKRFKELGYETQLFLLNAANMGVPQRRERVFFIARRKDLNIPPIKMDFRGKPILYKEFADEQYKPINRDTLEYKRWLRRSPADNSIGDTVKRTEMGKISGFNSVYIKPDRVPGTLTAGNPMVRFDVPGHPSDKDILKIQSFPQDYDFNGNDLTYVCGMSVPPLMMRGVAREVQRQILDKIGQIE